MAYFKHNVSVYFNNPNFTLVSFLAMAVQEVIFSFSERELNKCNQAFTNIYEYALKHQLINQDILQDGMERIIEIQLNDNTRPFLSRILLSGQEQSDLDLNVWKMKFAVAPEDSLKGLLAPESGFNIIQIKSLLHRLKDDFKEIYPDLSLKLLEEINTITAHLVKTRDDFPAPDGLYADPRYFSLPPTS